MKKTIVVNLLLNTVGAFLYTVAINGFLISNHLGEGGVTGLMTIFYYLLKIAPSLTNIVLNGLLLLIGWKLLNKQTVFYTLYTITMISVFLKLIGSMRFPLHDPLVAALIGGALMGVAMGFIMKGEGTLAGSTILARIVNKFFGIKTGSAMLCFDLMVAIPSAAIIGFENMLLTIVELSKTESKKSLIVLVLDWHVRRKVFGLKTLLVLIGKQSLKTSTISLTRAQ